MALGRFPISGKTVRGTTVKWFGQKVSDKLLREMEIVYRREANKIVLRAKLLAPAGETGVLKNSIVSEVTRGKDRVRGFIGIKRGSPADDYAGSIEFGFNQGKGKKNVFREDSLGRTKLQVEQPFLRPALNLSQGSLMRSIKQIGPKLERTNFAVGAVTKAVG